MTINIEESGCLGSASVEGLGEYSSPWLRPIIWSTVGLCVVCMVSIFERRLHTLANRWEGMSYLAYRTCIFTCTKVALLNGKCPLSMRYRTPGSRRHCRAFVFLLLVELQGPVHRVSQIVELLSSSERKPGPSHRA